MSDDLIEVHLVNLPVPVWARAQEHGDELVREMSLIAEQLHEHRNSSDLPVRLTEVVTALTARYGNLSAEQEADLADAAKRSLPEIARLTFRVPAHAAEAAIQLGQLLDDADEYCRAGQHLLTLATPPESVRFRNWYLGEFARQVAGEAPTPWPAYQG